MKFVCVECDEPMKFDASPGLDEDGSLPVTFRCPSCDWGVTMLTNPQETQLVRTLGVKIGGSEVAPPPLEMMRGFLGGAHPPTAKSTGEDGKAAGSASKCPFSQVVKDLTEE